MATRLVSFSKSLDADFAWGRRHRGGDDDGGHSLGSATVVEDRGANVPRGRAWVALVAGFGRVSRRCFCSTVECGTITTFVCFACRLKVPQDEAGATLSIGEILLRRVLRKYVGASGKGPERVIMS